MSESKVFYNLVRSANPPPDSHPPEESKHRLIDGDKLYAALEHGSYYTNVKVMTRDKVEVGSGDFFGRDGVLRCVKYTLENDEVKAVPIEALWKWLALHGVFMRDALGCWECYNYRDCRDCWRDKILHEAEGTLP